MPQLLILRHAIALDRDEAASLGLGDAERPLTEKGQRRMTQVASGLSRMVEKPALILSSPLLRARQTAEILAARYAGMDIDIVEELSPGTPAPHLLKLIKHQQVAGPLVLVGHEPDLSLFTALLLCGKERGFVQLKKAGAALLEFEHRIDSGEAWLQWLLQPKHLRHYAKS